MKSSRSGIFFGILSVITGALLPLATLALYITSGFEGIYWFPVVFEIFPVNLILGACIILSIAFGWLAARKPGSPRVLGLIGIYLCALQIIGYASLIISIKLS